VRVSVAYAIGLGRMLSGSLSLLLKLKGAPRATSGFGHLQTFRGRAPRVRFTLESGHRGLMSTRPSTTLADLLTVLFFTASSSAVWALLR